MLSGRRPSAPASTLASTLFACMLAFTCVVNLADAQSRRSRSNPDGATYPPAGTGEFSTGTNDEVVAFIDAQVAESWNLNEIKPSPIAGDAEWIRRVFLDIAGHVPPAERVEQFLADEDPAKRAKLVDELLASPAYERNMTAVWTSLAIGRGNVQRVSRDGMQRFWREAFAKNRPWDEVMVELMTATGYAMVAGDPNVPRPEPAPGEEETFRENGAVNYWLAQMQMRDEMVQATAKTARLFLGIQVQCTQCHNHPFNDWKQDQFWQFNSFFRQMQARNQERYDPRTGRQQDWYSEITWRDYSGPVSFEKRSGEMVVAYPTYFDEEINPDAYTDRRSEFAKLIVDGEKPLIAQAMVNRTWGQFFGYGFTKPVDDMGPHNPPSDPVLFDRLTSEFVKGRYDVKQLIRWIANSEAYNLTSAFREDDENAIDNPAAGETPLFSHMYVKSLSPEQLFDSLIVATEANRAGGKNWEQAEDQRNRWMQQFVMAFDTDENDEATTFNGTIPQALMMMNGELTKDAVTAKAGSFLYRTLDGYKTDEERYERLFLATLSRRPTTTEDRKLATTFKMLKDNREKLPVYEDLFWALLNSNEFIFNH